MKKIKCSFCDVPLKSVWDNDADLKYWNEHELGVEEQGCLYLFKDKKGIYILGSGECVVDYYYPKYCPECGRKLKGDGEDEI